MLIYLFPLSPLSDTVPSLGMVTLDSDWTRKKRKKTKNVKKEEEEEEFEDDTQIRYPMWKLPELLEKKVTKNKDGQFLCKICFKKVGCNIGNSLHFGLGLRRFSVFFRSRPRVPWAPTSRGSTWSSGVTVARPARPSTTTDPACLSTSRQSTRIGEG